MSPSQLLPNSKRGIYYPLSSRASSATLFLSKCTPSSHVDGTTDLLDMSIAKGLLETESPRIPRRRSSFSHSTAAQQPRLPVADSEQLADAGFRRDRRSRQDISSNTWTSSTGERSEDDGNDDRTPFVEEYNRLAKRYGVQTIIPDEFIAVDVEKVVISAKPGSWIMRKLLRRTSSIHVSRHKTEKHVRPKRSVSDISLGMKPKKDSLKGKDLMELVRICGASPLYLPSDYTAGTLNVPTCFRATAQYLVQHASTSRGIFRIPGAHSTINALYNHYASPDEDWEVINGTVRCPTLPEHIQCNVHDVASAFKKFLAGLPGGFLGKPWLLDAFMSIHSQLDAEAEWMRTKQSKVRARLIALAIATVVPRYQRELICAVLGILSMIGRAAETAPREDEHGRPLPTSDLMGYSALGIVFGPLLVGSLLESHRLCPSGPHGSFIFVHQTPTKSSKGKHRKNKSTDDSITLMQGADKIRIINTITEMLITHWRDVVRHMKNLGALKPMIRHQGLAGESTGELIPPLVPELFSIRRPQDWDAEKSSICHVDRSRSPTPSSRNSRIKIKPSPSGITNSPQDGTLSIRKRRPRARPSQTLSGAKSMSVLAPTMEEVPVEERHEQLSPDLGQELSQNFVNLLDESAANISQSNQTFHATYSGLPGKSSLRKSIVEKSEALPQLIIQEQVPMQSSKEDSTKSLGNSQIKSNIAHQVFQERYFSGETSIIELHKPKDKELRTLQFYDPQKQREELSKDPAAANQSLGNSNSVENQPEDFSKVPNETLSSRLHNIIPRDSGLETPLGFVGVLKADHKGTHSQNRRLSGTADGSHTFERCAKDPLSRVSHKDDIASLVSLAEIIKSQEELVQHGSLQRSESVTHPKTRSPVSVSSTVELRSTEPLSEMVDHMDLKEDIPFDTKTTSPGDKRPLPTTPRRSATDLSVHLLRGGSIVKALAARFGNIETNARQTPSPVHTPKSRAWQGSLVEKAVVAPYTVNTSPIPMARKLNRSDSSLQTVRNPMQGRMSTAVSSTMLQSTASALPPKSSFPNPTVHKDSGPPRWPVLYTANRNPQRDSDAVQVWRNSDVLRPLSSGLHRTGDGNASFALSRKSSPSSILPRPDQLPIVGNVDSARFVATYTDHFLSPFELSISCPFGNYGLPSACVDPPMMKNRKTSILHTQIQDLSGQLKAKVDQTDHLKQHLKTKDCLNDLETLKQQLRETKRDLAKWRGRAEMAEKRLEMLSQMAQKEVEDTVVDEQSVTDSLKSSGRNVVELDEFDGICNDRNLPGSDRTVRRTSPDLWDVSEKQELYNVYERLSFNSYHHR